MPDDPRFDGSVNGKNGHEISSIYEEREEQNALGEGQFGVVYRRYHIYTGQDVAVKRTKPTPLDLQAGRITTYDDVCNKCQEVRTLLKLRRSASNRAGENHVLQLYEFFWENSNHNMQLNLVTELLEGNLREWLVDQETFSETEARTVATSILKGLDFMHSHNVVHRDIKEEVSNVFEWMIE